jgi:ABC-type arginine/histidine transport system permease subunit
MSSFYFVIHAILIVLIAVRRYGNSEVASCKKTTRIALQFDGCPMQVQLWILVSKCKANEVRDFTTPQ